MDNNRFQWPVRPVALSENCVTGKYYRFTVLTDRLIRMEYDPSGTFEDRASQTVFYRDLPLCSFEVSRENGTLRINTGALLLEYTEDTPFAADTFVKGQMTAALAVETTVLDTSVYVRISLKKADYTYVLRHDITSLGYQEGEYRENSVAVLHFCFDDYAFLIQKGECLQIDISATDKNSYVCHTNKKGAYYWQTETERAITRVHLEKSYLCLPVESSSDRG